MWRGSSGLLDEMLKRLPLEDIPFCVQLDLPELLPTDEMDMCLVLSNLLENALEASLCTATVRRQIKVTAYVHAGRILEML